MELPEYTKLLAKLVSYPQETEWIEFKHNFHSEEKIGQRLSALSNSAALLNEPFGYLVFGIEDGTHAIVGTSFKAKRHKKGNEELEMWLLNRLNPRIDIECIEFDADSKHISMYRIPAAIDRPVTFLNTAYIRVSAALLNEPFGYLVFGIEDGTHAIVGTSFKAKRHKKGNEELEMWLLNRLNPRIDIECIEFDADSKHISMYRIPAAIDRPVTFLNTAYIRVGSIMRRMGFCEEKGSGMDKALSAIERYQLPPIKYRVSGIRTTIILSASKKWADITKEERVQACYQHACLKYLANEMLTNKSLRERLGVDEKNYPLVSVVIKEALAQGLIKIGTPEGTNRRDIAYIPHWG